MKAFTIILLFLMGVSVCLAEPFFLKNNATGKLHGPYQFRSNGKVVIDKKTYTIVKPKRPEPTIMQKLTRTKIPEIDFRQAAFTDVLQYLRQASMEHSPYKHAKHPGVNIIVNMTPAEQKRVSAISFKAKDLSVLEILKAVLSVADLEYEVTSRWVMIRVKKK